MHATTTRRRMPSDQRQDIAEQLARGNITWQEFTEEYQPTFNEFIDIAARVERIKKEQEG